VLRRLRTPTGAQPLAMLAQDNFTNCRLYCELGTDLQLLHACTSKEDYSLT